MPDLNDAVVVAATRSPIGRANKGSSTSSRRLMADAVALCGQGPQVPSGVGDIIAQRVAQTGRDRVHIARTADPAASDSVPAHLPALRFIAQAITAAASAVKVGNIHACGMESPRPPAPRARRAAAAVGQGRAGSAQRVSPKLLGAPWFPSSIHCDDGRERRRSTVMRGRT
jgi:acetyl-CoA acetyltransferase